MNVLRLIARRLPGLLLAGLLVGAQVGALAHAFEHDPGTPQFNLCAACVTVAQLGAAAVNAPQDLVLDHSHAVAQHVEPFSPVLADRATARQRGPPANLPQPR